MEWLADSFGRRIRTLRISLTDHCNFRCVYCMPPEGLPVLPKSDYLTTDEIVRFVSVAGRIGVERVRLTGGEPLLRREIVDIVRALKRDADINEVSMTTNASLLHDYAETLRDAGLSRINISLDSLDAQRFADVSRSDQYRRVRDNIDLAIELGFPVKINVVVLDGMPDEEILSFADLAVAHDVDVRFLEFMPLCGTAWDSARVYPIARVRGLVSRARAA